MLIQRVVLFSLTLSISASVSAGILKGNASVDLNKNYQLTNGTDKSVGGLWSASTVDLTSDINISFEIKLNNHTANEGFAFIFLHDNSRNLGEAGPGLGIGGIDTSLAIEFDVRSNLMHDDEHSNGVDHLAVRLNGRFDPAGNLSKNIPLQGIADGNYHHVRIKYASIFKQLEVYWDGKKVLQLAYDLKKVFYGKTDAYWGLTAAGAMGKSFVTVRNFSLPMDVYMMYLKVEKSGNDKLVSWATSYEHSTEKFEIYRSYDGSVWGLAAVLPSTGPSSTVTVYTFLDQGFGDSDVVYLMRRVDYTGSDEYLPVMNVVPDPGVIAGYVVEMAGYVIEDKKKENDPAESSHNFYDPVGRHIYYGTLSDFMKICQPGLIYFSDNRHKYVKF